jgi:hypothetical protein
MGDRHNTVMLVGMLIMFAVIFFIAYAGLKSEETLFGIGIPAVFENWLIMFLSSGSMIKIVWELYKR